MLKGAARRCLWLIPLALVVLTALMLTAGGLALANRSSQGPLASVYQMFGLQAREAAEIGVTRGS